MALDIFRPYVHIICSPPALPPYSKICTLKLGRDHESSLGDWPLLTFQARAVSLILEFTSRGPSD